MQRKLIPSGNGWALYMPKDLLKLLGYSPDSTTVLLQINDNVLKITEINPQKANPNALLKTFNKNGNGYGIYLSNSIIQLLEIIPENDEVKYRIKNNTLYIEKAKDYPYRL